MGKRGSNTSTARQRLNIKNSMNKLEALLTVNFREGAQLVTLAYEESTRVPSRKLAYIQARDWLRAVWDKQGHRLRYIRAMSWEKGGGGCPVHRVVVALPGASAALLDSLWEYGPVEVEMVQGEAVGSLASLIMRQTLEEGCNPVSCGRLWSPSIGLIRPETKGEKRYELSDTHSGGVPSGRQIF